MTASQASPAFSNPAESAARAAKAVKLVGVLVAHGATGDDVRALPPAGRRMAEALAGVREGSDATWAVVVTLMDHRQQFVADPFAGLPGCEAS